MIMEKNTTNGETIFVYDLSDTNIFYDFSFLLSSCCCCCCCFRFWSSLNMQFSSFKNESSSLDVLVDGDCCRCCWCWCCEPFPFHLELKHIIICLYIIVEYTWKEDIKYQPATTAIRQWISMNAKCEQFHCESRNIEKRQKKNNTFCLNWENRNWFSK